MIQPAGILPGLCAAVYALLVPLIVWRARQVTPLLLAACCGITAVWAGAAAILPGLSAAGITSGADLLRALTWFGFVFFLYHDAHLGRPSHEAGFAAGGLLAALLGLAAWFPQGEAALPGPSFSWAIIGRLTLAITELLLIENLYLNLPSHARWHIALPSVLLGGLACFDIVLCADWVIFHASSPGLLGARTVGMIMIAPLLMVAAVRGQRWKGRVRLSRSAVFHSATLILSGGVLMTLAVAGEAFRHVDQPWGWLAEASLAFAALIGIGLFSTSASARSWVHRLFVDHFFAERYDYRRQWLACIRTLSGADGDPQSALPARAIRTIASVVDSPAGALFLRDGASGPLAWAGSWNMPSADAIPPGHPAVLAVADGTWIARLDQSATNAAVAPLDGLGPLWLVVPLLHRESLTGLVFVAPPRAPFPLEQEVFDLLRILAKEVSTYIAEQKATQTLLQTRQMHDYSQRFAFVAHDIKNVSSQLALLLANARQHISNPEFQHDMLETVGSSVRKIKALLERLERPDVKQAPGAMAPLPQLESLVGTYRRVRNAGVTLESDGSTATVAMGVEAFETALTHLLNNAVEASPGLPVVVRLRHEARQVVIDIIDRGVGMTPEFIRDELFRPFSTMKASGSGIGAYQSRALLRGAGGDLEVASEPGRGTTMRLRLPRTDGSQGAADSARQTSLLAATQ